MPRLNPMRMTIRLLLPALICVGAVYGVMYYAARVSQGKNSFSKDELRIIRESSDVMYVTQEMDSLDHIILRKESTEVPAQVLKGNDYQMLARKMLVTVQDPSQDGVGLAAPQIGINRRIAAVQRFDKEGEPFEVYANLKIERLYGAEIDSPEGCLSYPPFAGIVPRRDSVIISYSDPASGDRVLETVGGYTAIIFQHECDHLDGHLYIDKADTVVVNPVWEAERTAFSYEKPGWFDELQRRLFKTDN